MRAGFIFALLLVFCACGARQEPKSAVASSKVVKRYDPMQFIMEGSDVLIVIDIRGLLSSPMMSSPGVKAEFEKAMREEDIQEIIAMGVDPFTNVDRVIISSSLASHSSVVVMEGSFDAVKVADSMRAQIAAEEKPGVVESVGEHLLLLAANSEELVLARSGRGFGGSPSLEEFSGTAVALSASVISAVVKLSPEVANEIFQGAPFPMFAAIRALSLGVNVTTGIDLRLSLRFLSAEDAAQMGGFLSAMLPMFGLPRELISALQIEVAEDHIDLSVSLSESQLKQLQESTTRAEPPPMPFSE